MAQAMTIFGSTLSDLQRLTNEDKALDYSRASQQDSINAQRLSEFLKARSEENRTKADRDRFAADLLDRQQGRAMQGSQFDTQQRNLMSLESQRLAADKELQGMAGSNALEIAKLQSANRPMDPRYFQSLTDVQALNQEQQQKSKYAQQLSNARKAALAERNQLKGGMFDFGEPNRNPRWKQLGDVIANLDTQAGTLGIAVGPDGGYIVPDYTPIQIPPMLNQNPVNSTPSTPAVPVDPLPFLSTDSPPVRTAVPPTRTFEVTPDGTFRFLP